jgi:drug/metabolite transporter (DMT)-like permease
VKRIGASIPAMAVTSGALMLVAPLLLLSWAIFGGTLPLSVTPRASWSIVYLGVFGSVLGFNFYFYVIKRMEAGQIALITLITPVSALLLGQFLNSEKIQSGIWLGAACVLLGLISHQWQLLSSGLRRAVAEKYTLLKVQMHHADPPNGQ